MINKKKLIFRLVTLFSIVVVFVLFASYELFNLQVINGETFKEKADKRLSGNTPIYAARGEIVDRNGEKLVSNSRTFILRFNKSTWNDENQNNMILQLVSLLERYNNTYTQSLPITLNNDMYEFSSDTKEIFEFLKKKKAPDNIDTAESVVNFLKERYSIDDTVSKQDVYHIISVRYQMEKENFSSFNSYIFATDISAEIVTTIKEQSEKYIGVEIDVKPIREYQTPYASHILGRVGPIFKEEYEELKDSGYKMNAIVGKDGIEKVLEPYLRATDGKIAADLVVGDEVLAKGEQVDPIAGNNAVLTIDLNLQRVAEESLAKTIEAIRENGKKTKKGGEDAKGGAAVVIDVKTGEILALASYPTYSLETFNQDYNTLLNDPLKPMINRAISSSYPPGSTYKMATSLAALEEGVATPQTKIKDQGIYTFYAPNYAPRCWIYRDRGITHGTLDVSGAIKHSCNYYFFEVGRLLTAERMENYAKMLGLGEYTGIELTGENKGNVAGPTSRKSKGQTWYPGDTLQAAIGQSDHLFTPLQLANYVATLANGGTLNKAHLIKRIESFDYSEVIMENNPEPISTISIKDENLAAILQGMSDVVNEGGTAASVFRNYPIKVAGKTGSAQLGTGSAHGVFVSFAPFDNPEIAVCVLGENAGSGGNVAPVVRDIYNQYFGLNKTENTTQTTPQNTTQTTPQNTTQTTPQNTTQTTPQNTTQTTPQNTTQTTPPTIVDTQIEKPNEQETQQNTEENEIQLE